MILYYHKNCKTLKPHKPEICIKVKDLKQAEQIILNEKNVKNAFINYYFNHRIIITRKRNIIITHYY